MLYQTNKVCLSFFTVQTGGGADHLTLRHTKEGNISLEEEESSQNSIDDEQQQQRRQQQQ